MSGAVNPDDVLPTFLSKLEDAGINDFVGAAQEQLAEIEAERLSLLMQLDSAKQNAKQYREEAIASLSQKLRAESEKLKNKIQSLEKTKKKLTDETQVLSQQNARQTIDFFSQNMQ